jgi:hypothetical protein
MITREKKVVGMNKVEMERTDVATFLGGLASRLRNDALALTGLAWRHSHPGNADQEDLHGLARSSLERTAALLEAVKDRLWQRCQLLDVAEQVTLGAVPEVERKPKTKGARIHGKEEGQERKGRRQ